MEKLKERMGTLGEVLAQFAGSVLIPRLEAAAGSERNVVTGTYSGTFDAEVEGSEGAAVTTEAYYWKYLEYGTSRGIKPKPIVPDAIENIQEELAQYITDGMSLAEVMQQ